MENTKASAEVLSEETRQNIARALSEIRMEIQKAKNAAGRTDEVILLAATKTVPPEQINYAIRECGLTHIGENRVQELLSKYDALEKDGVEIHFIGRLQKNKVKYIIDKVSMIHSLDSLSLAKEIHRQAQKHGRTMDVLIEINSGREESKGGLFPEELPSFLEEVSKLNALRVKGLMTIAPICENKEDSLKYFKETYEIFIDFLKKKPHNIDVSVLSMGMSDSYCQAIACGSNLVRIGSAIFGRRHYPEKG